MQHTGKLLVALLLSSINASDLYAALPLDKIELPDNFSIEIYAEGIREARQMVLAPGGTVFVGSRKTGKVYAVSDTDADGIAEKIYTIDSGLKLPSGVAFRDGSLYVGVVSTILRYDDIENRLDNPPDPVVVTNAFPSKTLHGWKYLGFGPDGKLYVPVGVPCNICVASGHGVIKRMNPDGSDIEVYAMGVRNSVGITWHPQTGELWFTDNGRDNLGDELPSCELNHAPRQGMHFGFPYCHQGDLPDRKYGKGKNCADYSPPAVKLGPHVSPLGLEFYTGNMFPEEYRNQLFIAEHGSWNRSRKIGYRIKLVRFNSDGSVAGQQVFASGWLQGQDNWGRPNDVLVMPDGALLISDDQAGVIYRVSYRN